MVRGVQFAPGNELSQNHIIAIYCHPNLANGSRVLTLAVCRYLDAVTSALRRAILSFPN
jgi:hypothetical protein